jgi:hypothetical protein
MKRPDDDATQQVIVPEPPVFDRRRTRRAVWRGITRTAILVLVAYLALSFVWRAVGVAWTAPGRDHFEAVAGQGFFVGHPGYMAQRASCCDLGSAFDASLDLPLSVRRPGGDASSVTVTMRRDWRGRLDPLPAVVQGTETPVDMAFGLGPPAKAATAKLLDRLPGPVTASAVVDLAVPMDQAAFDAWAARYDAPLTFHHAVLMSAVYPAHQPSVVPLSRPLAWSDPDVAGFRRWAAGLGPGDDANLGVLYLPGAEAIKAVAAEGRIHGLIIDSATPAQLRALLADRAVASVRLAEVTFDLGQQDG